MRDVPSLVWFIAIVVVAIIHRWLPMPGWLMLHLLFLGAATHAILTWSQHFTAALTRSPVTDRERSNQNLRLILSNLGMVAIFVGVPSAIWPLTVTGTSLLIVAVVWHGASIWRKLRGSLPGRFSGTVRYYILSAACLPIGAALGAWIALPQHGNAGLTLGHALINVLGWIGITVAGTLVTLWPTMLRTRAAEHSARSAIRALPVLGLGVLAAAVGAIVGQPLVVAAGLLLYVVGLALIGVSLFREARQAPPRTFSTLSATAALLWWIACLIIVIVAAIRAGILSLGILPVVLAVDWAAPYFAAGFAAQILLGALSYLVPVVIGGGPGPVRLGNAIFDRGAALRVTLANTSLLVCALPVSSTTRVIASLAYLGAMASFIPLMLTALRRQGKAKRAQAELSVAERRDAAAPPPDAPANASTDGSADASLDARSGASPSTPRGPGQATAALVTILLVVAAGAAIDPGTQRPVASGTASSVPVAESAPQEVVRVEARGMSFTPDRIEVPAGTHLIIELTNADDELVHDLVFQNGVGGSRLAPGETERIDLGVITGDLDGWCSIIGHRQMGMTLDVVAIVGASESLSDNSAADGTEADDSVADGSEAHEHHTSSGKSAASLIDPARQPDDGFQARDAALVPLSASSEPTVHRITLDVTDVVAEVAPGVRQNLWLFGGSAPGPTLHGRVGDTFEITLVNDGSIGHSIDFHAGSLAPNEPMRTIAPGETLTYTFTATRSGIWMYHCSTHPMSAHIANGMYGAVIIEPAELPEVDRSYVLVQGEYYLGAQDGEVDMDRIWTGNPDLLAFNGYAAQYEYDPLPARVGERVRVWLLNAGPNRASSFHVVGGQFDTVWFEGAYLLERGVDSGSQALGLQPAQGGFVELTFPEAGDYPFVSHVMIHAERGARGVFHVDSGDH